MLAVKRVKTTATEDPQNKTKRELKQGIAVAALKSELDLLKDLDHPNIVQCLGRFLLLIAFCFLTSKTYPRWTKADSIIKYTHDSFFFG